MDPFMFYLAQTDGQDTMAGNNNCVEGSKEGRNMLCLSQSLSQVVTLVFNQKPNIITYLRT